MTASGDIPRRRLLAMAVVSLLGLAACGSEDDEDASPGTTADVSGAVDAQTSDEDAQALVFAECMRTNGVDMPDPGSGQQAFIDALHSTMGSYDRGEIQAAVDKCNDYFPTYAGMGHGGSSADQLALAECLREQGLDVPDDLFGSGALAGIDADELTAALEACRDVVGGGGG